LRERNELRIILRINFHLAVAEVHCHLIEDVVLVELTKARTVGGDRLLVFGDFLLLLGQLRLLLLQSLVLRF
jgi:hypothetical protein